MSPCYVDQDPLFYPAMRVISSITQDTFLTEITTSTPHGYQAGLIVRFNIPKVCGMQEIDKKTYQIIDVTSPDVFRIALDSSRFTPFSIPVVPDPPWALTCAQITPISGCSRNLLDRDQEV